MTVSTMRYADRSKTPAFDGNYVPGQYGFICVGIGGTVTAVEDDWVEIEGVRMPRSLAGGPAVRYLSIDLPAQREHVEQCDSCTGMQNTVERESLAWSDLIRSRHDEEHDEPWAFCPDRMCRHLREVGP